MCLSSQLGNCRDDLDTMNYNLNELRYDALSSPADSNLNFIVEIEQGKEIIKYRECRALAFWHETSQSFTLIFTLFLTLCLGFRNYKGCCVC